MISPLALSLIVLGADTLAAFVVFIALSRRGHPLALPIAGMLLIMGIVGAVMVYKFTPVPAAVESAP